MNTVKTFLLAGCTLAMGLTACNTTEKDIVIVTAPMEANFMNRAAQGNLAEIEAGMLADSKATEALVKSFGVQMVADHKAAQSNLEAVATSLAYKLPTAPDSMHKAMTMKLSTMTGRMFDSTYIYAQVKDHEATVNLLNAIIESTELTTLKKYAETSLPTVQMHYNRAENIARTLFP